jgi:hypothetical protein
MLTQDRLKYLLHYDPETGDWTWLNPPNHNTRLKGRLAGNRRHDGYLRIRIDGGLFYSSHLACLYMTGKLPDKEMDHIDRNPANDKWSNLRQATSSQNKYNRALNSGWRGVYRSGSNWWAMVGRENYLGLFPTLEEALAARDAEAKRLGGDFAILNGERT